MAQDDRDVDGALVRMELAINQNADDDHSYFSALAASNDAEVRAAIEAACGGPA